MTRLRRLRIFIAHPSEVLTDHLPHGDGLVACGLIRRLAERGHELHVATQRVALRAPLPATVRLYPLSTTDGTGVAERLAYMWRLRWLYGRLSRDEPFDVIHQMNPVFTGLTLALAGAEAPVVLGAFIPRWTADCTGDVVERPPLLSRVKEAGERAVAGWQQARAAGVLVASRQARSRIQAPLQEGRIFEVPHGVDVARFTPRTVPPPGRSILFLTSVQYRKGIFTLLDAFEQVAREMPDAELVVAGEGPALPEVRERAAARPSCRIRFVGPVTREDVPVVMRGHSVYCLPSIGEPFGMTILEAMACGVPVVATRAGGVPDLLVEPGGRLVPPRDPAALAQALLDVLASPALQRYMGAFNRARVEDVFDIDKTVDRLERAYAAIVGPSPVAHRRIRAHAREVCR